MQEFYSNGKLLITGEYAVLEGGLSFALPTKFGQELLISPIEKAKLVWKSYTHDKRCWFETSFELNDLSVTRKDKKEETLRQILLEAKMQNPDFLDPSQGYLVETHLTFPTNWGLGTSSTLINNIADWAKIDAFELLEKSFGGSGYDIACAQNDFPIYYQRIPKKPKVEVVNFNPNFRDQVFFVYLNQKQDSKQGIQMFSNLKGNKTALIQDISNITTKITQVKDLKSFEDLLNTHENLMSEYLGVPKVKDLYFQDFPGTVKSLGAWGGDFVLVTGDESTPTYFKKKGFDTILSYKEMIL